MTMAAVLLLIVGRPRFDSQVPLSKNLSGRVCVCMIKCRGCSPQAHTRPGGGLGTGREEEELV